MTDTLVYGYDFDDERMYVLTEAAVGELIPQAKKVAFLLDAKWSDISHGIDSLDPEVRSLVDEEIGFRLDDAWEALRMLTDPVSRPVGWFPADDDDHPGCDWGDWLSIQPRPNDPMCNGLPEEISAIARQSSSMVSGDFEQFEPEQLDDLIAAATELGMTVRRDDDAINSCWPKFWQ